LDLREFQVNWRAGAFVFFFMERRGRWMS